MYSVGKIAYAVLENKKVIIPIKIVEEITVKNLESELTTYKVLIPNNKDKVDLSKFKKVFDSIEEASSYMLENAKNAIDELALKALEFEEKFFSSNTSVVNETCNNDNNKVKIDLGNGTTANIDVNSLDNLNLKQEENENNLEESVATWRL